MYAIHYSDKVEYYEVGDRPHPLDVQVIVQEHPAVGWHTQSGSDFYIWDDGRWVGVFDFGLFQYLDLQGRLRPSNGNKYNVLVNGEWQELNSGAFYFWLKESGCVLFGRTLTQAEFNVVMASALANLGDAKTGWLRNERRLDG
jgi:hypothetical protein